MLLIINKWFTPLVTCLDGYLLMFLTVYTFSSLTRSWIQIPNMSWNIVIFVSLSNPNMSRNVEILKITLFRIHQIKYVVFHTTACQSDLYLVEKLLWPSYQVPPFEIFCPTHLNPFALKNAMIHRLDPLTTTWT